MIEDILAAIRDFVGEYNKKTPGFGEIEPDDPFFEDGDLHLRDEGYMDSVGLIELQESLEERFGITITPKDITLCKMDTVNEIAQVVASKLEK